MDFSCGHSLYPREFSLVPEVEECTNAIFGVKVAVVLDEPESTFDVSGFLMLERFDTRRWKLYPLQVLLDMSMIAFWLTISPKRRP